MKRKSYDIKKAVAEYSKLALKAKQLTEEAKYSKEFIVKYAQDNKDLFAGKVLHLDNGVSVQRKENKDKVTFSQDLATHEWLAKAIDGGLGDLITINIEAPQDKLTRKQLEILKEIDFVREAKCDTYAVTTNV